MKLKDLYQLDETTSAGAVGGFVGKKGQDIDQLFAGPYHPEYGKLEKLLQQQIDDMEEKVENNIDITPILDLVYRYDRDNYEKIINLVTKEGTPYKDSNNLKNIRFDYTGYENYEEKMEKFHNCGNDWKEIYTRKLGEDNE